jgi:hypothetical protein
VLRQLIVRDQRGGLDINHRKGKSQCTLVFLSQRLLLPKVWKKLRQGVKYYLHSNLHQVPSVQQDNEIILGEANIQFHLFSHQPLHTHPPCPK